MLSDAAQPNTLSTMRGKPADGAARRAEPRAEPDPRFERGPMPRARSGSPSLGTILLLVFLAITAIRVIGELLR